MPPDPAGQSLRLLYGERDQLEDELDALAAAAAVVRGDLKRMQSDRDDLCAELAAQQRQLDVLLADIAEGQRRIDELRGFEREYRGRLAGWLEAGAALLKGDGRG